MGEARFSGEIEEILRLSQKEALRLGHNHVGTEHLLLGIIKNNTGIAFQVLQKLTNNKIKKIVEEIEKLTKRTKKQTTKDMSLTRESEKVLKITYLEAQIFNSKIINTEHLLLSILRDENSIATQILYQLNIDYSSVIEYLNEELENNKNYSLSEKKDTAFDSLTNHDMKESTHTKEGSKKSSLDNFGKDLTKLAEQGKLDPIIGRIKEIERVMQVLSRRKKNNPILIGEPGVGKSAIAEGLALKICKKQVSHTLFNKRIFTLDLASIVAGTKYRGQFEERIKNIMHEITSLKNIILFIDEIHTMVGAGGAAGSLDASNILKPALSHGEIQCIGATTLSEYRQYIEKDGALARRFQSITIDSLSNKDTLEVLTKIKSKYESHHHVRYTREALNSCIQFSNRYITDRFLPDKAIDLMDEAGSKVHMNHIKLPSTVLKVKKEIDSIKEKKNQAVNNQNYEKAAHLRDTEKELDESLKTIICEWEKEKSEKVYTVTTENVAEVISIMTNIPLNKITKTENRKLLRMNEAINKSIIGQEEAIDKLVRALKRSRIGLKQHNKPIGSFIFLGPTGVGKTALAKEIASYLFSKEDSLIRIDMSEYMEKFSVSRLIGSPPGYVGYEEGGQLTEKIRRKPYNVILLDEIEKAHNEVFNILLQIMDEGFLTDSLGRKVDFRNTVLIMTSNIGSQELKNIENQVGFNLNKGKSIKEISKQSIRKAIKDTFSPEFINRIDDIIVFNTLEKDNVLKIIDIAIEDLTTRIENIGYHAIISPSVRDMIFEKGYSKEYGARPIYRAIQTYIEDPMVDKILSNNYRKGKTIQISYDIIAKNIKIVALEAKN